MSATPKKPSAPPKKEVAPGQGGQGDSRQALTIEALVELSKSSFVVHEPVIEKGEVVTRLTDEAFGSDDVIIE